MDVGYHIFSIHIHTEWNLLFRTPGTHFVLVGESIKQNTIIKSLNFPNTITLPSPIMYMFASLWSSTLRTYSRYTHLFHTSHNKEHSYLTPSLHLLVQSSSHVLTSFENFLFLEVILWLPVSHPFYNFNCLLYHSLVCSVSSWDSRIYCLQPIQKLVFLLIPPLLQSTINFHFCTAKWRILLCVIGTLLRLRE